MLISINRNTDLSAISGTPPQFRMILVWFHTFAMMTYSRVAFLTSSKVKVTWYVTLYTIFAKLKGNSNIICQNCMHKLKKMINYIPVTSHSTKNMSLQHFRRQSVQIVKVTCTHLKPHKACTETHYQISWCLMKKMIFLVLLRRFVFERLKDIINQDYCDTWHPCGGAYRPGTLRDIDVQLITAKRAFSFDTVYKRWGTENQTPWRFIFI